MSSSARTTASSRRRRSPRRSPRATSSSRRPRARSRTRRRASAPTDNGARGATMPTVTADMLARADGRRLRRPCGSAARAVADLLSAAGEAHVTCPRGTDLHLDLSGREAVADDGVLTAPGAFGNLPCGEGFIAPRRGRGNGRHALAGLDRHCHGRAAAAGPSRTGGSRAPGPEGERLFALLTGRRRAGHEPRRARHRHQRAREADRQHPRGREDPRHGPRRLRGQRGIGGTVSGAGPPRPRRAPSATLDRRRAPPCSTPGRYRARTRCCSPCRTSPRAATPRRWTRSAPPSPPAARACSTATPTPTTTGRCSRWPASPARRRRRSLAVPAEAVERIDIRATPACIPHVGAVDVAPVVYLDASSRGAALRRGARRSPTPRHELGLPGVPLRRCWPAGAPAPQLRRGGPRGLAGRMADGLTPDFGPARLHPTAGARSSPRARRSSPSTSSSGPASRRRRAGRSPRRSARAASEGLPGVRAIGLTLAARGGVAQVSCNVEDHGAVPLAACSGRRAPRAGRRRPSSSAWRPRPRSRAGPIAADSQPGQHRGATRVLSAWPDQAKRRTKHRGNAAGMVETRGRTGRKPTAPSAGRRRAGGARTASQAAELAQRVQPRRDRRDASSSRRDPRADDQPAPALTLGGFLLLFYMPLSYYTDIFVYRRRQARSWSREALAVDARMFTVGPLQENCYLVRADGADRALLIDPGDEAPRLQAAMDELGVELEAILLTHTHFDHIGAVAPVARATGAPVYCPRVELAVLGDIMRSCPPGFGPFEGWKAEHALAGGERLSWPASTSRSLSTPGHSPGHVTFAIPGAALFSGDVLFQGRSAAPTCPGPTTRRSWPRSPACSSASTTTHRPPRAHGLTRSARAAPRTLPARTLAGALSEQAPGAARHVRRAARRGRRAREPRGRRARGSSSRPATGGSRRRPSRRPSCSRAAWASRPTSSRRRCTRSRTPAGGR